ncbi:MAG: nitroreductase [Clostridia bacterium]|nr:nitroreductase [Clostridia bacterium]
MIYKKIEKRTSVRTFQIKPLTEVDKLWIRQTIEEISKEKGPFRNQIHFRLLNADPNKSGKPVGTYGLIKNAQSYITGVIPNSDDQLCDFGYLMEKIIIRLTGKNIGTCWLGGTFKRENFKEALTVKEGYIIPAVVPVGYAMDSRSSVEKAMRLFAKSNSRQDWSQLFFLSDFDTPLEKEEHKNEIGNLTDAFESVRLAPSASNKQPWKMVLDFEKSNVYVYINENPNYSGNKMGFKMQRIDAGIALYHFEAIAKENGINGEWEFNIPSVKVPSENYQYIATYHFDRQST